MTGPQNHQYNSNATPVAKGLISTKLVDKSGSVLLPIPGFGLRPRLVQATASEYIRHRLATYTLTSMVGADTHWFVNEVLFS